MKQYLLCICFWALFTFLLYGFGNVLAPKKNHSYKLIVGYICYSFLVAVVGIPLQLLNAPWIAFAIYMGVLWLFILGVIIHGQVKRKVQIFDFHFKDYICENWMVYIITAVLIAMLFFYYAAFYLGDHQDDGYYITRVATLPTMTLGGNFNYAVGVENSGFNSYIINTWEAEASVYVKILGVVPTLFLRIFQSSFYYFLVTNLFKVVGDLIFEKLEIKNGKKFSQFVPLFFPLICTYYLYMKHHNILDMRDNFFLESGMFLGSTMVRLCGLLFFLIWYMEMDRAGSESKNSETKNLIRMILGSGIIAVVLMSKSTIALPDILIAGIAIASLWMIEHYDKTGKIFVCGCGIIYVILGIILPNNQAVQEDVYGNAASSLTSYAMIPFLLIFIASFFLLRNCWVKKINILILVMALLILIPQCNDVFEKCSIYGFVGGRAWTSLVYVFILINMIYFVAILSTVKANELVIRVVCMLLFVTLSAQMVYAFSAEGGNLVSEDLTAKTDLATCLKIFRENTKAVPDSTIYLGEALEQLATEKGTKIRVVMPKLILVDDAVHSLAISIRAFAPDIISVSANQRYRVNTDDTIGTYFQENYDAFMANPNQETEKAFADEIAGRSIDCIVTTNLNYEEYMEDMGYSYYGYSRDGYYYLWCAN